MKKLLFLFAALLPGLLAHSQEAEDLGRYAEVSIIPSLDINPGNSSLYTLFESSVSDHLSFVFANHWLQSDTERTPFASSSWLYDGLGRSNTTNWVDYFNATFSFNSWSATIGKDLIALGGFEAEEWDWDLHPEFSSPLLGDLSCYQWGGKVSYTTPSEKSEFILQMTSSPFGEKPLSSSLWAYSLQWRGEYGIFSNIWSVSALEKERGEFDYLFCLGQRFQVSENFAVTADWNNNSGFNEDDFTLLKGNTVRSSLTYTSSDERFECSGVAYYSSPCSNDVEISDHWTAGAVFHYYPLDGSDDFRVHAYGGYDSALEDYFVGLGLRYYIRLKLF